MSNLIEYTKEKNVYARMKRKTKKLCWNAIKCFVDSLGRMVLVRDELRYCKQMSHKFTSLYLLNFEVMWCDVMRCYAVPVNTCASQTCNHFKKNNTHTHNQIRHTIFKYQQLLARKDWLDTLQWFCHTIEKPMLPFEHKNPFSFDCKQ